MFFELELAVVTRMLVSRANARDLAAHPAPEAATILAAAVALTKFRGGGFRRAAVVTLLGAIAAGGLAWALPDGVFLDARFVSAWRCWWLWQGSAGSSGTDAT